MNAKNTRLDLAADVVAQAKALGAQEVSAAVVESSSINLTRRDGKVEQASEATSRRLSLSLMVDDKFSSHSTSDLRPEAVQTFLARAVAATGLLEPDPERRLPDPALMGRGTSEEALDHLDPTYADWTPDDRARLAESMEMAMDARRADDFISSTSYYSDGRSHYTQVTSNGFSDESEGAWYSLGSTLTLRDEGGRRPEGSSFYAVRHRADLPTVDAIADQAVERSRQAVGSGPTESGRYPMFLENRVAGRILGILSGPLSGSAIHYGRSCLADKLGQSIGSSLLTLVDDPTIPRGLGSTPWDEDLLKAQRRTIVDAGVLQQHYLDVYYARKLGRDPTTGSRTNWVVPPGERSWQALAKERDKSILVTGFLGGNANPLTGDFSFGIRGLLLENGEVVQSLSEMNVAGNLLDIFHKLAAVGDDPWTWSATRSPTLLFDDVAFSGT